MFFNNLETCFFHGDHSAGRSDQGGSVKLLTCVLLGHASSREWEQKLVFRVPVLSSTQYYLVNNQETCS